MPGMTDPAPTETPVAIDRVDRRPAADDAVTLRLTGRRLGPATAYEPEPLLVVQLQGRRHRFTARRDRHPAAGSGGWQATFDLPAWAEPSRDGQAALWVGDAVVPVPLPGSTGSAPLPGRPAEASPDDPPARARAPVSPDPPAPVSPDSPAPVSPDPPAPVSPDPPAPVSPAPTAPASSEAPPDSGRTGPLAELLLKESVSALHSELEQGSAEAARLRSALAETQSALEARAARQAALEATQVQLGAQLRQLMTAAAAQREEFTERAAELTAGRDAQAMEAARLRERLAAASSAQQQRDTELAGLRAQLASVQVSRDATVSELTGLREELARLGTELAVAREQISAHTGDLGDAQRLLADARALTEQLREQNPQ